ncbi:unnamed protein product [Didymodactylos carnosus]|uniref:Major facilitator superfamily (MFS) profile domain-containing protein n=1 Tax=Didymodactylos carnosus TaxID=1234261 RepID=A0A813PH20_9BILA|nr:unnamed protein product [Didymodactylos carnosus]CAF0754881.1 unnamed protein product [Didymodactylos carnosus]CAF3502472.1 unnamed protein product [Didymodactylos carnosus]CAF3535103.1 unnamed protein product [Didymodactylos carnosus]
MIYDCIRKHFGVIIVIVTFISRCVFVGFCWSYGTVIVELKKNSSLTDTELSWIGSFGQTLGGVLAPLILYLVTHCGHQIIFILSLLTCSFSLLLSSNIKNIHLLFLTYSVPYGFANASLVIIGTLLTGIYYPPEHEYHLLTICIISTGFPIGYHLMSAIIFKWIQNDGWMEMNRRIGIIEFILTIVLGSLFSSKYILISQTNTETEKNIRKFFSKKIIYWMIGIFTSMCSISNFLLHLHSQLEILNITPAKADLWFRLHGLFDALFRFSVPFILKYFPIKIIYLFSIAAFSVFSFTSAVVTSLQYTVSSKLFDNNLREQGYCYHVIVTSLGTLFGPIIGGLLVDFTGSYKILIPTSIILLFISFIGFTANIFIDNSIPESTHYHNQVQSNPNNMEQNCLTERTNPAHDNFGYKN